MEYQKIYIGDGVYATSDGFHLILETEDQRIFLDTGARDALRMILKKYIEEGDGALAAGFEG